MPFTREEVAALELPEGWRWSRRPDLDEYYNEPIAGVADMDPMPTTPTEVRQAIRALYEWALGFVPQGKYVMLELSGNNTFMQGGEVRRHRYTAAVYPNYDQPADHEYALNCGCAGDDATYTVRIWDDACPGCSRELVCGGCGFLTQFGMIYDGDTDRYYCRRCTRSCQMRLGTNVSYGRRCGRQFYGRNFMYCPEHGTRIACSGCDLLAERPNMFEGEAGALYCASCTEYVCRQCGALDRNRTLAYSELLDLLLCPPCNAEYANMTKDEEFDDTDPGASALVLESNPHRPVRICSVELECAGPGGNALAKRLHEAGLAQWNKVVSYHSSQNSAAFCHVEYDRSLGEDGGELIFNKINLADSRDAESMHRAVTIVREQIKAKKLVMDMRCGFHNHIDAHGLGLGDVRNVVLLFNYLEDPLYQMAAAKYAMHRGTRYSNKIDKGPYGTKQDFGAQFLARNNHNHALNVSHYWAAMQGCKCGAAMVGEHENCKCTLNKCTLEFRVWNGTANIRKIAAYVAISQSLVAYAKTMDDLNADDFPVCEYFHARVLNDTTYAQWFERMEWMLQNLYFSNSERENVLYVINNSPLRRMGEDRLAALAATQYQPPNGLEAQEYTPRVGRGIQPDFTTTFDDLMINLTIPEPMHDDYDMGPGYIDDDEGDY